MDRPVEIIELPSGGKLYDGAMKDGKVKISPMGAREEALLAGKIDREDAHLILDTIIQRCLDSDVAIDELLSSDKFYILLMIRNISYGNIYSWEIKCTECGFKVMKHLNIPGDFTVTLLDEGVKEPFFAELPRCNKRVGFRLMRVKDEKDIETYTNNELRRGVNTEGDVGYVYRIAKYITSIDDIPVGEETAEVTECNISDAVAFVEELIGGDIALLKNKIAKEDSGVNLLVDTKCVKCKETYKTPMKFTPEFFRPESVEV